jgi:hypothetical protein
MVYSILEGVPLQFLFFRISVYMYRKALFTTHVDEHIIVHWLLNLSIFLANYRSTNLTLKNVN